jgi:hypothetical protein
MATQTVLNLGQVKLLHKGATAPTNTDLVWYDTTVNLHKYYNTQAGAWATFVVNLGDYLLKSGAAQTVGSIITFTNSPKVPAGSANTDAVNKSQLNTVATAVSTLETTVNSNYTTLQNEIDAIGGNLLHSNGYGSETKSDGSLTVTQGLIAGAYKGFYDSQNYSSPYTSRNSNNMSLQEYMGQFTIGGNAGDWLYLGYIYSAGYFSNNWEIDIQMYNDVIKTYKFKATRNSDPTYDGNWYKVVPTESNIPGDFDVDLEIRWVYPQGHDMRFRNVSVNPDGNAKSIQYHLKSYGGNLTGPYLSTGNDTNNPTNWITIPRSNFYDITARSYASNGNITLSDSGSGNIATINALGLSTTNGAFQFYNDLLFPHNSRLKFRSADGIDMSLFSPGNGGLLWLGVGSALFSFGADGNLVDWNSAKRFLKDGDAINNQSSTPQSASFNISGNGTMGGSLGVGGSVIFSQGTLKNFGIPSSSAPLITDSLGYVGAADHVSFANSGISVAGVFTGSNKGVQFSAKSEATKNALDMSPPYQNEGHVLYQADGNKGLYLYMDTTSFNDGDWFKILTTRDAGLTTNVTTGANQWDYKSAFLLSPYDGNGVTQATITVHYNNGGSMSEVGKYELVANSGSLVGSYELRPLVHTNQANIGVYVKSRNDGFEIGTYALVAGADTSVSISIECAVKGTTIFPDQTVSGNFSGRLQPWIYARWTFEGNYLYRYDQYNDQATPLMTKGVGSEVQVMRSGAGQNGYQPVAAIGSGRFGDAFVVNNNLFIGRYDDAAGSTNDYGQYTSRGFRSVHGTDGQYSGFDLVYFQTTFNTGYEGWYFNDNVNGQTKYLHVPTDASDEVGFFRNYMEMRGGIGIGLNKYLFFSSPNASLFTIGTTDPALPNSNIITTMPIRSGRLAVREDVTVANGLTLDITDGIALSLGFITPQRINMVGGLTPDFGGIGTSQIFIGSALADRYRSTRYYTGSSKRWEFGANGEAEGGANTGTNFVLDAYDDAGTTMIGQYLNINRATGIITVIGDIVNATAGNGIVLKSPDGTSYKITVANGGIVTSIAV